MYFEDIKIILLFLVLSTFVFLVSPFIFVNYDIVISPKPVEILEQQDLLARINSLETDNENLQTELATYPPKPIDYSITIIWVVFICVIFSFVIFLRWQELKQKELKILQEKHVKKK